jgi:pectate lyase
MRCGGIIVAAGMLLLQSAQAAVPFYDGVDYSTGNLGAVGGAGDWDSASSSFIAVASGTLTGPAGSPVSAGNRVVVTKGGATNFATFATSGELTSGQVYFSFLFKPGNSGGSSSTGLNILALAAQNSSTPAIVIQNRNNNGYKLGVGKAGGTVSYTAGANITNGTTFLVVGKYDYSTSPHTVSLWIRTTFSSTEAGAGTPTYSINPAGDFSDPSGIGRIYLNAGGASTAGFEIDEFRVATTWAGVTTGGPAGPATKLGFTTQPANAAPGATMSPVVVQVQDAIGLPAASNGVPVTLTLSSGSGTLSGTLTQNTDSSGKATFNDLSVDTAGTGKQFTASASGIGAGLTAAVSGSFAIVVPSVGTKLAFTTQPPNSIANVIMGAVVVQVQDPSNVAVSSNGVPVTLTLTSGSGTLNGTLTQNTDPSGKATFTNLSVDTVGTGKQLTAAASGIGVGLTSAVSSPFSITTVPVGGLAITSAQMTPAGLVVNGVNDTPGVFCQVLGAVEVNASTNDWIIISYDNFDGTGHISFTNPVSPAMPKTFYRLRTGDTVTKTQPPSIGIPPANLIVSPGATATFTVTASGPILQYLWYFNGNAIAGATASSLVITNAQAGNIGNYSVAVANPAGNITSAPATLGIGNVAPTITSGPSDQTVTAGGTAIFNVGATGTFPLTYQWYYNTNTLLTDKTNAQLTLTSVSTNDAGKYSVRVSNSFGNPFSTNATLTVNEAPTGLPDTNMIGFAAIAGVTGGSFGGSTTSIICSNYASFSNAVRVLTPLIIYVQGTITNTESYCYIYGNNKTITGLGTNAAFIGDLRANATNIIIQNLYFTSTLANSDGVTIDGGSKGTGKNVWVDHCTFYNLPDGSVDITKGADYVTVSWCKFSYAPVPPGVVNHEFVNLIASSDSDNGSQYHVTFHHNWYGDYCRERMPSVRFGRVHVFNNYYNCAGNNYCVRTRIDAQVLVENNYFIGVQNPWERFNKTSSNGLLKASGNNVTGPGDTSFGVTWVNLWVADAVLIPGNDVLTDPSLTSAIYTYALDSAADVPYFVQTFAGSGKYPYVAP